MLLRVKVSITDKMLHTKMPICTRSLRVMYCISTIPFRRIRKQVKGGVFYAVFIERSCTDRHLGMQYSGSRTYVKLI